MKIYNTMTNKMEQFVPLEANKVKLYVCGPTVYNYIHLGNARPLVVFDTLAGTHYRGYEVKYVLKFYGYRRQDNKKSAGRGVDAREISEKYIAELF